MLSSAINIYFKLLSVYDVNGSDGLYTLVNSRGVYFKNNKGYDGASSALIQGPFETILRHMIYDYMITAWISSMLVILQSFMNNYQFNK